MVAWNETDYVTKSKELAAKVATTQGSINDASVKVAREFGLNPDEIRTLVRLTNVSMFQHKFAAMSGDVDRMVEFDVGDPEQVIRKLAEDAASVPQTASITNDKLAFELPDMMREKRLGGVFDTEKVAEAYEPIPEKPLRRDHALLAATKLAAEFDVERRIAGQRWEDKLAQLAQTFRRAPGYGPALEDFEKDAYAEFGDDAVPELTQLWENLRKGEYTPAESEKIAEVQDRHLTDDTAELRLLKEAVDARHHYVKFTRSAEKIAQLARNPRV